MAGEEDFKALSMVWTVNPFKSSSPIVDVYSPQFKSENCQVFWQLRVRKTENGTNVLRICQPRPFSSSLDVELSLIDSDGSVLLLKEFRNQKYKDLHENCNLQWRKSGSTSLTVRCTIWKTECAHQMPKTVFARTEIGDKHFSFLWDIKNFSTLKPSQKTVVELKTEREPKSLNLELNLDAQGAVSVKLSYIDSYHFYQMSIYSTFQVCVLDFTSEVVDSEINSSEINFNSSINLEQVLNFPLLRQKLTSNEKRFLPGDILLLRCEVTMSGTLLHIFESDQFSIQELLSTSLSSPELGIQTMHPADQNSDNSLRKKSVPSKTLKAMFENKLFCDYTLRAESQYFPVHRAVLCSRSTVFRDMFNGHMKETRNNYADMPNVDPATLQRFLLYLYTDDVDTCQEWEDAYQLYSLADQYKVLSLREKCRDLLKCQLTTANAGEIRVLADTHQDEDLKAAADIHLTAEETDSVSMSGTSFVRKGDV